MKIPFWPIVKSPNSSNAVVLGYDLYGEDCPKIVEKIGDFFRALSDAKYWALYRFSPSYQYHIVRTELEPDYHCPDKVMLFACMKLLCQYVERFTKIAREEDKGKSPEQIIEEFNAELSKEPNSWGGEHSEQIKAQETALKIYRWWKYEKPQNEKRREELMRLLYDGPQRITFKPCEDNPEYSQMIFRPDVGEEIEWRKELNILDEKIEREEQEMLEELVKIRRWLWH